MPKGSPGLSAVARRRLQKDVPLPPSRDRQRKAPTVKRPRDAEGNDDVRKSKRLQRQELLYSAAASSLESSDHEESDFKNSFASLADHAPSTDAFGQIEQLANKRIKVLVAKGKKVLITGMCWLWVKSGTVTVYGAVLPSSEAVYRLYAPFSYSLPTIEVLSDVAEVELSSLDEGLQGLAKLSKRNIWDPPTGAEPVDRTFFVLGHHFTMETDLIPHHELDITSWQSPLSQISKPEGTEPTAARSHTRILITGKRSSGVSTFVRCLINRLLTQMDDSGNLNHSEVALIDLDYEFPEITPPGSVAVTRIKEPLLGPSFTHPGTAFEIRKLHFVETPTSRMLVQHFADAMDDFTQTVQEPGMPNIPVIIHLPAWVTAAKSDVIEKLWKAFGVSELVQVDGLSTSMLDSLATSNGVPVRRIAPNSMDNRPSASDDHDLRMQSYFHKSGPTARQSFWNDTPLTAIAGARKFLRLTQSQGTVAAVMLLDPLVDAEDTHNAILGTIGAVVAVARDHFDQELRPHARTLRGCLPVLICSEAFRVPPSQSECLGMAYVAEVDTETLEVVVYTPISEAVLAAESDRILLLVHPSRRQHRWLHSGWIAKEIESAEP